MPFVLSNTRYMHSFFLWSDSHKMGVILFFMGGLCNASYIMDAYVHLCPKASPPVPTFGCIIDGSSTPPPPPSKTHVQHKNQKVKPGSLSDQRGLTRPTGASLRSRFPGSGFPETYKLYVSMVPPHRFSKPLLLQLWPMPTTGICLQRPFSTSAKYRSCQNWLGD